MENEIDIYVEEGIIFAEKIIDRKSMLEYIGVEFENVGWMSRVEQNKTFNDMLDNCDIYDIIIEDVAKECEIDYNRNNWKYKYEISHGDTETTIFLELWETCI